MVEKYSIDLYNHYLALCQCIKNLGALKISQVRYNSPTLKKPTPHSDVQ